MPNETREPTEPTELAIVYDITSGQPLDETPRPPISPYHPTMRAIAGAVIRISE